MEIWNEQMDRNATTFDSLDEALISIRVPKIVDEQVFSDLDSTEVPLEEP